MLDKKSRFSNLWTYLICIVIIFAYIMPLYVMVNVSIRIFSDLSSRLIPTKDPIADNFMKILTDPNFFVAFKNTVVYAIFEMLLLIPIGAIGGYGLSRSRGKIVTFVRSLNVMIMMIPGTALLVGTYGMMVKLKLTNNLFGLALLGAGGGMTGCMFFYTSFCASIPVDLDEAASIDGAGVIRTFFTIIFPQMQAITITRLIGVLTGCWNNYLMPMYLLNKSENYTLILYARKLFSSSTMDFPVAVAACTLMVIPILIFYFIMQKQIIGGQLDSAVKG